MNAADIITSLLSLIAGIGTFLVACAMMSSNLEALGSGKLKALFGKAAKSKLVGAGAGAAATAVIQSSGATSVMVIGCVNAGIMTLTQGAAVIFGANIGTTVTGQLVALGLFGGSGVSASAVFSTFAGVGAFVSAFAKTDKTAKIGGVISGFGLLFVGLSMMSGAMSRFSELYSVRDFLARFENPFVLLVVGMLLTAIIQSSSVMTSTVITMTVSGLITLDQGIYITLGADIGSCATALIAGLAGTKNAKRLALIHLLFNVGGVMLFMLIGCVLRLCGTDFGMLMGSMLSAAPQLQLAVFHTLFNIITVIIILPFTDSLADLAVKLVPDGNPVSERRSRT